MLLPHHIASAGTVGSGLITLAVGTESADWRVIAVNAVLTLGSAALATYLKKSSPGKSVRKRKPKKVKSPDNGAN